MKKSIPISLEELRNYLSQFSLEDVLTAVFTLSTWLNNRGSLLQQRAIYLTLFTIPEGSFNKHQKIDEFSFKTFCEKIIALVSTLEVNEDFLPEGDWGEVKYFYQDRFFRIICGDDLSYSYDQLQSFEMIINSANKEIAQLTKKNPSEHFVHILSIYDKISAGISTYEQKYNDQAKPGYMECPTDLYFTEVSKSYPGIISELQLNQDFKSEFFAAPGDLKFEDLQNHLSEYLYNSRNFCKLGMKLEERYFPISPRLILNPFLGVWQKLIESNFHGLSKMVQNPPLSIRIGTEYGQYLRSRIGERVQLLVSALDSNEKAMDVIYPFTFTCEKKIYFFIFAPPILKPETWRKELTNIENDIRMTTQALLRNASLYLSLEQQIVKYSGREKIDPKFIVVIPAIDAGNHAYPIPLKFPAEVMFGMDILGVFDELKDVEEFDIFFRFINRGQDMTFGAAFSLLDRFAAFRDSNAVLIPGANTPSRVILDPHWGSSFRNKSLREFWKTYPPINLFGHPRTWIVEKLSGTRTLMFHRLTRSCATYFKIKKTDVFVNAPVQEMEYTTKRISDALIQCLEDYFSNHSTVISSHSFWEYTDKLQMLLFPKSLVLGNKKFSHLLHLSTSGKLLSFDSGTPDKGWVGLRIVFDDNAIIEEFSRLEDAASEVNFIANIIQALDQITPCSNLPKILLYLDQLRSEKPAYTFTSEKKPFSFPDGIRPIKPEERHFKIVQKKVAMISKNIGLEPGEYSSTEARDKVNSVLIKMSTEIDAVFANFNFSEVAASLIQNINALIYDDSRHKMDLKTINSRRVDYDIGAVNEERQQDFFSMHRNYSFLIEKVKLISPSGRKSFDDDSVEYLLAFADWYLSFADTSDQINHGLFEVRFYISEDFRLNVIHSEEQKKNNEKFSKYIASRSAKLTPQKDFITSPRTKNEHLETLDSAFKKELQFTLSNLILTLDVLSEWGYITKAMERPYFIATADAITRVCTEQLKDLTQPECSRIIRFLTLEAHNILKIINKDTSSTIIPTWEHYKRHSRYQIRPLISVEDSLIWGPCSTYRSRGIWMSSAERGKSPVYLGPNIEKTFNEEKILHEKSLEKMAFEISSRFTHKVELNVDLYNRFKKDGYPPIGDYDCLAFFPEKNLIVSIECKHILPAFCLKDMRRLKDDFFGKNNLEQKSYVGKAQKRHEYLKQNLGKISKSLKWDIHDLSQIVIKSFILSIEPYLWTYCPPYPTDISFILLEELDSILENLSKKN